MQHLNYLIVGSKNDTKQRALAIATKFFQDQKIMEQEILQVHPEDNKITVKQIEELVTKMNTTSLFADQSGYIIFEADKITAMAQNKLLKTLEEAQASKIQILTTENPESIIDTVKSRLIQVDIQQKTSTEKMLALKTHKVDQKYLNLLITLFDDELEALAMYQKNINQLNNILKLKQLLSENQVKAYLFYNDNLKKEPSEFIIKAFTYIFEQTEDVSKLLLLNDIKHNLKNNLNTNMQLERIFWE